MIQLGIFLAATVGSWTLFRVVTNSWRPGRKQIRRRLSGDIGVAVERPNRLYRDLDSWAADSLSDADLEIPNAGRGPSTLQNRASRYLREAGTGLTIRQVAFIALALGLVMGTAAGWYVGWLAGLAGFATGALTPGVILHANRKARRDRYQRQLQGAFELMARILRSGQTVPEAFRAVVETFDDPLADEFGHCLHQIEHGIRPDVAYRELSHRSNVLELRIFVVAMAIHRQCGGNLAEVLDRLADLVRTRVRLRQKLRALTAEGRLQSLTLVLLPVVTFGVMYFLNRGYAETLLEQWQLLLATGGCMAVGVLWIRNIMSFEG